jgi:hypothetical protein
MRVALLFAACAALLLVPRAAAAQTDEIGLYSDAGYSNCKLIDDAPGQAKVYVVHHVTSGATASQFMIRESSGVMLTYLYEQSPFNLIIGNTQSGIAISYTSCLYSDVLVSVITYLKSGSSSACSSLQVVADPNCSIDGIEVVGCFENVMEGSGTRLVINPDGSCDCGPTSEMTNWGRIKDRYSD